MSTNWKRRNTKLIKCITDFLAIPHQKRQIYLHTAACGEMHKGAEELSDFVDKHRKLCEELKKAGA
jgi:hypothetical protein